MAQETDLFIPEEVLKNLGRWTSDAHLVYLKSFDAALKARRFIEEEIVKRFANTKISNRKKGGTGGGWKTKSRLGSVAAQPPTARGQKRVRFNLKKN